MAKSPSKRSRPGRGTVFSSPAGVRSTEEIDQLVRQIIARVADKWTMLVLEVLADRGIIDFQKGLGQ